ncbi:hypothetical protein D0911_03070 [Zhongshania marina]|uniref:Uncharacterized protein n=1 Tax=Zhongshania marina TaxID=2304603 RepID=A0ABX9W6E2_9GAMM|nr:hypothetical protein D0911_03070 [Zhongshania marina]
MIFVGGRAEADELRSDFARAIAVGARSYGGWYAGFVGGRWPRPPSLAMKPQFTLAEADELRARPLFVPIAGGRGELCSNPARANRGRRPLLRVIVRWFL